MYEDRIRKQTAGEFHPVVFSTGGVIGDAAKKVIRAIADKLSDKSDEDIKKKKLLIKSDISFSLIRSKISSIRNPKRNIQDQLRSFNGM